MARLGNKGRMVNKEFSSLPAPVIRREDSLASVGLSPVFPIGATYQSLKLSLDDSTGMSRTIFLPRISFGSQRVAAGGPQTGTISAKGIW